MLLYKVSLISLTEFFLVYPPNNTICKSVFSGVLVGGGRSSWKSFRRVKQQGSQNCRFPIVLWEKSFLLCIWLICKIISQVDKLGLKEVKASLLMKLNRLSEAEQAYYTLLDINPENYKYILSFLRFLWDRPVSYFWMEIITNEATSNYMHALVWNKKNVHLNCCNSLWNSVWLVKKNKLSVGFLVRQ